MEVPAGFLRKQVNLGLNKTFFVIFCKEAEFFLLSLSHFPATPVWIATSKFIQVGLQVCKQFHRSYVSKCRFGIDFDFFFLWLENP